MVQISQRIYLSHILYENEYKYRYGEKKNELVQFTFANMNTGEEVVKKMTYEKAIELAYMRSKDGRYKNYEYLIDIAH